MGSSGLGLKRKEVSRDRVSVTDLPRTCGRLFLDSGAHSLYNLHAQKRRGPGKFAWFAKDGKLTKRFRKAMDDYAAFVKRYKTGVDHYATMDVIFNPVLSWLSYNYLRKEHGLDPMPVVHYGTDDIERWVGKYLDAGCKYLGVGGIGQEATKQSYTEWADKLFDYLCPRRNNYLPVVKTHGFAMTSVPLMARYPWYSVDSSRWAKAAGYGSVLVPHKRRGCDEFAFDEDPYLVCFSMRQESLERGSNSQVHYHTMPPRDKAIIERWLQEIDMPLGKVKKSGKVKEYGVVSQYHARAVANLRFFEWLGRKMPKYPWPFLVPVSTGGLFGK